MAAKFDNLADVSSKFSNTVCYLGKVPIYVKSAQSDPDDEKKFLLYGNHLSARGKYFKLDDPEFNYKNFNLGYANNGHQAQWWFRRPAKQYCQGLTKGQLGNRQSYVDPGDQVDPGKQPGSNFTFSKPFVSMLENSYPDLEWIRKHLMEGTLTVGAFHKDFALSWNKLHKDFILEYRSKLIGHSIGRNLNLVDDFILADDSQHLREALAEAIG